MFERTYSPLLHRSKLAQSCNLPLHKSNRLSYSTCLFQSLPQLPSQGLLPTPSVNFHPTPSLSSAPVPANVTRQSRAKIRTCHRFILLKRAKDGLYPSSPKELQKTAPDPRICLLPRHARIAESALHFQPHRFSYTPYGYLQMDATHPGGRTHHRTQRNRGSVQRRI